MTPYMKPGRRPTVTRLASERIEACVHTWKTFVDVTVTKNGSVFVTVIRGDKTLGDLVIPAEKGSDYHDN